MKVGGVACQRSYIGHTGIEIAGTHGMAHNLVLLQNGLVVLRIHARCMAVGAASRLIDEVLGTL